MSTYNICFHGKIRKIPIFFGLEKKSYQELCVLTVTVFSVPLKKPWTLKLAILRALRKDNNKKKKMPSEFLVY